ncbi:MAG: DHH family phosphoesterase [Phycisphaerales bacterium]
MEASGVYLDSTTAPPPTAVDPRSLGRGNAKRWRLRRVDVPTGETLAARVLAARGITDEGDRVARYLNPSLTHLHNPSLLPDIDRAATRLLDALKRQEPIVIYGDYDVDGVAATAILYHTLTHLASWMNVGPNIRTYVPHRLDEGYGLNRAAIESLAAEGARLIISVDCGVTAVDPARAAKAAGVDLIITDHHNPPQRDQDLPDAYAIVHPRRPGSQYPRSDLCGAGVAYKLAWRTCVLAQGERLNADTRNSSSNSFPSPPSAPSPTSFPSAASQARATRTASSPTSASPASARRPSSACAHSAKPPASPATRSASGTWASSSGRVSTPAAA